MPHDSWSYPYSEETRLEGILSRAESELETSLVYALLNKAQQIDNARLREELKPYWPPEYKSYKEVPGLVFPIDVPVSPPQVDIDWNIQRARLSFNPIWFLERLAPGGEMDYKRYEGRLRYEDFGNFNYGAVALAFGLNEEGALRGAGLIQIISNTTSFVEKKESMQLNNTS